MVTTGFWLTLNSNLPIGALVLGVLFFTLRIKGIDETVRKLPLKEKLQRMDLVGTVFFLGAICCLLLAWQWAGQSVPWKSSTIIGLFIGFGLLIGIFGYIQYRRGEHALVPLRILRQRSVLMGAFVLFFLGASTYVNTYYLPFYFQVVQGVDAVTSGIRFIPLFLPYMVALIVTGAIVTQWGYYVPYMILGEVIAIIGTAFLTRLDENTSTVAWAAYMVIAGIGMGMAMQLPYTAVQVVLRYVSPLFYNRRVNIYLLNPFYSEEDIAIGNGSYKRFLG
ncbi:MAG: hypothetical protein M1837_004622 [Sclerophora amabilis]|nr:MAG: hypothetical protein M1837_004622 [Sclerophora amabilis]